MAVPAEAHKVIGGSQLVFPTARCRSLSDFTLSKLLRELKVGAVPHGFRSSFRDWAAECSDAPRDVCELALAHVNSDRVEAAYRRSDLFEKRRDLMEDWSKYIAAENSEELPERASTHGGVNHSPGPLRHHGPVVSP